MKKDRKKRRTKKNELLAKMQGDYSELTQLLEEYNQYVENNIDIDDFEKLLKYRISVLDKLFADKVFCFSGYLHFIEEERYDIEFLKDRNLQTKNSAGQIERIGMIDLFLAMAQDGHHYAQILRKIDTIASKIDEAGKKLKISNSRLVNLRFSSLEYEALLETVDSQFDREILKKFVKNHKLKNELEFFRLKIAEKYIEYTKKLINTKKDFYENYLFENEDGELFGLVYGYTDGNNISSVPAKKDFLIDQVDSFNFMPEEFKKEIKNVILNCKDLDKVARYHSLIALIKLLQKEFWEKVNFDNFEFFDACLSNSETIFSRSLDMYINELGLQYKKIHFPKERIDEIEEFLNCYFTPQMYNYENVFAEQLGTTIEELNEKRKENPKEYQEYSRIMEMFNGLSNKTEIYRSSDLKKIHKTVKMQRETKAKVTIFIKRTFEQKVAELLKTPALEEEKDFSLDLEINKLYDLFANNGLVFRLSKEKLEDISIVNNLLDKNQTRIFSLKKQTLSKLYKQLDSSLKDTNNSFMESLIKELSESVYSYLLIKSSLNKIKKHLLETAQKDNLNSKYNQKISEILDYECSGMNKGAQKKIEEIKKVTSNLKQRIVFNKKLSEQDIVEIDLIYLQYLEAAELFIGTDSRVKLKSKPKTILNSFTTELKSSDFDSKNKELEVRQDCLEEITASSELIKQFFDVHQKNRLPLLLDILKILNKGVKVEPEKTSNGHFKLKFPEIFTKQVKKSLTYCVKHSSGSAAEDPFADPKAFAQAKKVFKDLGLAPLSPRAPSPPSSSLLEYKF